MLKMNVKCRNWGHHSVLPQSLLVPRVGIRKKLDLVTELDPEPRHPDEILG